MNGKIDLKKELAHLYAPSPKSPKIVDVPPLNFLMLDGRGNPNNNPVYQKVLSALYQLSYTLKFAYKKTAGIDYVVMPPEGLWWVEGKQEFTNQDKDNWSWTMMIAQPDFITPEFVEQAREQAVKKNPSPFLSEIRFQNFHEGTSVQLMHIGPYADEAHNILRMHDYARQQAYELAGKHHEIYLSDPRRAAPEKFRTVLRQPLRKAGSKLEDPLA